MQLIRPRLTLKHEAKHCVLYRWVGLAVLIDHQDDGLLQMQAKFFIGYKLDILCARLVGLDGLQRRDVYVAQILGRAVEVTQGMVC